jgi:hypothetical protein
MLQIITVDGGGSELFFPLFYDLFQSSYIPCRVATFIGNVKGKY